MWHLMYSETVLLPSLSLWAGNITKSTITQGNGALLLANVDRQLLFSHWIYTYYMSLQCYVTNYFERKMVGKLFDAITLRVYKKITNKNTRKPWG